MGTKSATIIVFLNFWGLYCWGSLEQCVLFLLPLWMKITSLFFIKKHISILKPTVHMCILLHQCIQCLTINRVSEAIISVQLSQTSFPLYSLGNLNRR